MALDAITKGNVIHEFRIEDELRRGYKKPLLLRLCRWFALWAPLGYRMIHGVDGSFYLLRVHILRRPDWLKKLPRWLTWWVPAIHLHHFFSSDRDPHAHNHPWRRSYSLILLRGYEEHRYDPVKERWLAPRRRKPWRIVRVDRNTYHKVYLLYGRPWTLFVTFGREADGEEAWGFYVPGRGHVAAGPYIRERGQEYSRGHKM